MFRYISKNKREKDQLPATVEQHSAITNGTDIYKVKNVIGYGSVAKVRLLEKQMTDDRSKCQKFALKIIKQHPEKMPHPDQEGSQEFEKLKLLGYGVAGFFEANKNKYKIIMTYFPGEDLRTFNDMLRDLSPLKRLAVGLKILEALESLHEKGLLHLDIKSNNILYDSETDAISLTDFSSVEKLRNNMAYVDLDRRNLFYLAPEVINDSIATVKSDLFSAGLALAEWFGYEIIRDLETSDVTLTKKSLEDGSGFYADQYIPNSLIASKMNDWLLKMLVSDANFRCTLAEAKYELLKIIEEFKFMPLHFPEPQYLEKQSSEVNEQDLGQIIYALQLEFGRLENRYKVKKDAVADNRKQCIKITIMQFRKKLQEGTLSYQGIINDLSKLKKDMLPAGTFAFLSQTSTGAGKIEAIKAEVQSMAANVLRYTRYT